MLKRACFVAHPRRSPRGPAAACVLLVAALSLSGLLHAAERILYEKRSAYAQIVVSEDEDGHRILRFGRRGARQSLVKPGDPDYLGLSYARVALTGLALAPDPARLMVVGLGGGTLPMVLKKYYPDATIDVVDVDPDVVDVARKYFGFREDRRLRAHVDDGRRFVETRREPYDVIMLDAFGTDNVPPHLATEEFLRAVRRIVSPQGVVIANIWNRVVNPRYDDMIRTYQEVFDDLYTLQLDSSANVILLALPAPRTLTAPELRRLCEEISARKAFGFRIGDDGRYGFEHVLVRNAAAAVLRDREPARSDAPPR